MIYQRRSQTKPVNPTPQDSYGTILKVGDEVVYNFSGELAIGTILEIKKFGYKVSYGVWWHLECDIRIQKKGEDHISKVKNPKGIISKKSL